MTQMDELINEVMDLIVPDEQTLPADAQACMDMKRLALNDNAIDMSPLSGFQPTTGKFIKHYCYDKFDEMFIELYDNGCELHVDPVTDFWYPKEFVSQAFEDAKVWKQRNHYFYRSLR